MYIHRGLGTGGGGSKQTAPRIRDLCSKKNLKVFLIYSYPLDKNRSMAPVYKIPINLPFKIHTVCSTQSLQKSVQKNNTKIKSAHKAKIVWTF